MKPYQYLSQIIAVLLLITIFIYHIGDYLIQVVEESTLSATTAHQLTWAVLCNLVTGLAILLIPILMYPIFQKQNKSLAMLYTGLRAMEFVILIFSSIVLLTWMRLSRQSSLNQESFQSIGDMLFAFHWTSNSVLMLFFGMSALIFYTLLFQANLVPQFLSVWGVVAAILVIVETLFKYFGSTLGLGLFAYIPIGLNELVLSFWLIFRGFYDLKE